jgi:hypothetical protein
MDDMELPAREGRIVTVGWSGWKALQAAPRTGFDVA